MTAYNVVRFRVKPGMEDAFIASQRKSLETPLSGALDAALIKTGERSYCFIGKWDKFDSIVAAGPNAANPHHSNGDRAFQPGDFIIMDGGV